MNVTLHCNTSDDVVKIKWAKDGIQVFLYSPLRKNKSRTNFTSERMSVDPNTPMILQISDVQESDEGIYTCSITYYNTTDIKTKWNLTTTTHDAEKRTSFYSGH